MWYTISWLFALCVVSDICRALPVLRGNHDLESSKDEYLSERKKWETQSSEVEDYEEVNDYIRKHNVRGNFNAKGQGVPKALSKPANDHEVSNFLGYETIHEGVPENSEAINSLLDGQEITEEFQKNSLEKLFSFNGSEEDTKVRVKRMSVLGNWGCPAGMIRYAGIGCFRKIH